MKAITVETLQKKNDIVVNYSDIFSKKEIYDLEIEVRPQMNDSDYFVRFCNYTCNLSETELEKMAFYNKKPYDMAYKRA